jgi:hypothetical protein
MPMTSKPSKAPMRKSQPRARRKTSIIQLIKRSVI